MGSLPLENAALHYAADGLLTSWKFPTTGNDSVLVGYSRTHQPISLSYSRTALDSLDELLARDTLDRVVQQSIAPLGSMNDTVRFFAYDSSGRLTTYANSLSADSSRITRIPAVANTSIRDVWPFLLATAVCWANVVYGVKTGKAMFLIRLVARREEKFLFWFAVFFSGLVGTLGIFFFLSWRAA